MKLYNAVVVIATTLLLSGCIKEDLSDCGIPDNLVLKLDLRDSDGSSLLVAKINSIDAFVYDAGNRFVMHKRVRKNAGNKLADITFTIQPGEYRVVCWGNIEDNTGIAANGKLPLDESYIETLSEVTGDALYYAPEVLPGDKVVAGEARSDGNYQVYTIVVPPNKATVKEMYFTRAHRTVNVFMRGYESEHEALVPKVRITNMPLRTDFLLQTDPARKNYTATSMQIDTEKGERLAASFNTPISSLADDTDIEIIRSSDSKAVAVIGLKRYVEDNKTKIKDLNEINIEVVFAENGAVYVEFPTWQSNPLNPEW